MANHHRVRQDHHYQPVTEASPIMLGWNRNDDEQQVEGMVYVAPRSHGDFFQMFDEGLRVLSMRSLIFRLYRCSFSIVMLWFLLFYFVFIEFFAFLVYAVARAHERGGNECIGGWPADGSFGEQFEISFSLSWTTFSTVGFGTVSPPEEHGCSGIRYLLAIEAFIGVLYSGYCGAIYYSKVSRTISQASVTFSSAICLHYGEGIERSTFRNFQSVEEEDAVAADDESKGNSNNGYPYLELRIVNDKANISGSEILGCKVVCFVTKLHASKEAAFGKSSYELPMENTSQPYLSYIMYLRSYLNEHSPLLKKSVRARIQELGGWPPEINDHASIRNCLSASVFQILVSFEGTSNLTANTVFKLKEYKLEDIYIGWKLVHVLRRTSAQKRKARKTGALIDFNLSHYIMPQKAGGEEPIGERSVESNVVRFLDNVEDSE